MRLEEHFHYNYTTEKHLAGSGSFGVGNVSSGGGSMVKSSSFGGGSASFGGAGSSMYCKYDFGSGINKVQTSPVKAVKG